MRSLSTSPHVAGSFAFLLLSCASDAGSSRASNVPSSASVVAPVVGPSLAATTRTEEDAKTSAAPGPKAQVAPVEQDDDAPKEDTTTVWNVPLGAAPARGATAPLVTIVEFSDFQCPFCKRVESTLARVKETYGREVRLVWRDEPLGFHPNALPAAELAREARAEKGDVGFWAAHDAIFESQPKLSGDDLEAVAKALGLDVARVKKAIADQKYAPQIQADLDLSDDLQASGTPHFFINGRRLVGAQPYERFKAIIDDEIQHAEDLMAKGTPRAALYATIMKGAQEPPLGEAITVTTRATAPFRGPANAPVVIDEFADFQCPYCTRAEETLGEITRTYGNRVKIVWRNLPLPFHAYAALAAEAAAEAQHQKGNIGFWAMHDALFAHQADHDADGSGLDRAALDRYAAAIGLDVPVFDKALDAHSRQGEVQEDANAALAAKINGTPAFVVAGVLVSGAQPFGVFRRIIDHALQTGTAAVHAN